MNTLIIDFYFQQEPTLLSTTVFFLNAKNPRYYKHMVLQKLNMMSRWRWWCNEVMMTLTAMMWWCHYDDGDDDVMLIQEKKWCQGNYVELTVQESKLITENNRLTSFDRREMVYLLLIMWNNLQQVIHWGNFI